VDLMSFRADVGSVVVLALLLFKVWAFVDALLRPAAAYTAADKLTKPAWLLLLGLSAVGQLFTGFLGLIAILGTVASIVYVVDVRPALLEVTRGRR
jgi:hypothetical protein